MKTLILVDLQNDFMPGGALGVPAGDEVAAVADRVIPHFDLVIATQDWHPPDHASFACNHPGRKVGETIDLGGIQQVLWPEHCVQDTLGAELVADLAVGQIDQVVRKGTDRDIDSYSGFFDNQRRKATELAGFLRDRGARTVHVMGLATDYCVKFTALDAVDLGFETVVIEDGCRGIDLNPGDVAAALEEMQRAGVVVIQSAELIG